MQCSLKSVHYFVDDLVAFVVAVSFFFLGVEQPVTLTLLASLVIAEMAIDVLVEKLSSDSLSSSLRLILPTVLLLLWLLLKDAIFNFVHKITMKLSI